MDKRELRQQKIIQYEWKKNVLSRKYQYLLPMVVALQVCLVELNTFRKTFTTSICFEKFLQGMQRFEAGSRMSFLIPGDWCLFFVFLLYITGKVSKDFTGGMGMQVLLRTGNTVRLWRAKYLVCIGNICIYFASAYLILILFCAWERESIRAVLLDREVFNGEQMLIQFVFPVLAACIICVWQMVVSMMSNSLFGILTMSVLLIVSAYVENKFLIGNYLMKLRVKELAADGFSYRWMGIFLLILLVAGCLSGKKVMERLDYIHIKGDL